LISPGATSTAADGINDRGDIVGIYFDNTGTLHGFLQQNGALTTIDVPGAILAFPFEINDRGQIVGEYQFADQEHIDSCWTIDNSLPLTMAHNCKAPA
jgi:probable HAF family extracellular repeat protein